MNAENEKVVSQGRMQWVFIVLAALAVVFLWGRDIIRMADWMIPNEIREGANVAIAQAFADGNNPYRNIGFEGQPDIYYMYPFLNNLIGAVIVKLTGIPSGQILLILNFLWTVLTGILIAHVVKHYTNHIYLAEIAFLISHYCGWRYTNVSAFPDMLGVLLMTLILYLCTCRIESMKSRKFIIGLSLLTVLCFYSKQYTVIVALPVFLFLFVGGYKKQCVLYAVMLMAFMGISVLFIYTTMPLYFVETLLMVSGSADNEFKWAITQFVKIGKLFFLEFFFVIIYFIQSIRRKRFKLDYVWISFWTIAVLLFYFGQNNGAHLSYYLQLWMPSVIIVCMRAVYSFICLAERNWQKFLLYLSVLCGAVWPGFFLHTPLLSEEQKENWNRVIEIADNSDAMLATPQMANYSVYNGLYMYDYGQNQYILRKEMDNFWKKAEGSELIKSIFPEVLELKKSHEQYRKRMLKMLNDKEFDVLMLVQDVGFVRDFTEFEQICKTKYELVEIIEIETGVWKWNLEVWR